MKKNKIKCCECVNLDTHKINDYHRYHCRKARIKIVDGFKSVPARIFHAGSAPDFCPRKAARACYEARKK